MKPRRSRARLLALLIAPSLLAWSGCSLSSNSSNSNNSGGSGVLAASPSNLQFGTIPSASRKELSETVTNSGGLAVTISQITTTTADFAVSGINPPVTLSPGQAATFKVAFAPQSTGSVMGELSITSNASNPTLSIALSGASAAPGQLAVLPASVNFGTVVVGASKTQSATLSAGNGPVTVSSAAMSSSQFSVSGFSLPLTISSGSTIPFTLTFSPQASGSASATLTFTGSQLDSGVTQILSGTGSPPPQHSVTLNWSPSPSSNVDGYNVYRATHSGGPYTQINFALDTSTTAVDGTVVSGQTYYYVVTAVSSSQESAYSNQATAVIPFP